MNIIFLKYCSFSIIDTSLERSGFFIRVVKSNVSRHFSIFFLTFSECFQQKFLFCVLIVNRLKTPGFHKIIN